MARCAQRRQTGGCTLTTRSSFTSHVNARLSNTRMPMCTLSRHQPSGGQSHSSSHQQLAKSTRLSSSCKTDRSSLSNKISRSSSSKTYSSICSKSRASLRFMTTMTLKTSFMSTAIGALNTNTSLSTL